MKPLIGITMNLEEQQTRNLNALDQDYGAAVEGAGGIPVAIVGIKRSIPDLVRGLDGFLFTGGDDVNPRYYREKPLPKGRLTLSPDRRTEFEIALLREIMKTKKPVLAICHGAQLLNVALGGTLYQDIPVQVAGAAQHGPAKPGEKIFHDVDIFEGTLLFSIMGISKISVRSSHHQSIKNPGRGLRLSGVSSDGVVEALESRSRDFFLAVQWHPEKTASDRFTKKLFEAFIRACRR